MSMPPSPGLQPPSALGAATFAALEQRVAAEIERRNATNSVTRYHVVHYHPPPASAPRAEWTATVVEVGNRTRAHCVHYNRSVASTSAVHLHLGGRVWRHAHVLEEVHSLPTRCYAVPQANTSEIIRANARASYGAIAVYIESSGFIYPIDACVQLAAPIAKLQRPSQEAPSSPKAVLSDATPPRSTRVAECRTRGGTPRALLDDFDAQPVADDVSSARSPAGRDAAAEGLLALAHHGGA